MARKARTVPLKIIRLSLDALDPVESRVLRRLTEIGQELRNTIEFEMSQDEVDRYALKRLLVDALVYESNGARSAFTAAGQDPVAAFVSPLNATTPAPAAVVAAQPVVQEAVSSVAPAAPVATPLPVEDVRTQPAPAQQELPQPAAVDENAPPAAQTPANSWQEQLLNESGKPTPSVSPLLQNLSWPGEDD